jgi:hypothetical protein
MCGWMESGSRLLWLPHILLRVPCKITIVFPTSMLGRKTSIEAAAEQVLSRLHDRDEASEAVAYLMQHRPKIALKPGGRASRTRHARIKF